MRISDYPFTQEAAEAVRGKNISLDSLLYRSLFQAVRSRAAERLRGAIGEAIPEGGAKSESEQLFELLSYPLARVMVSCLNDPLLLRRYALAEAKLAFKRMQQEKEGLVVLANDLGINPQGPGPWKIHFSEYIRAAYRMRSPKWKLANRDLADGYLTVTDVELRRLLEEAIRERVLRGLPVPVDEGLCQSLEEYLAPARRELEALAARQKVDLGEVREGAFPPCIKKMLADVSRGTNLAHSARFALVSFLLQINMTPEEVIALFAASPDFDQDRTRYQVEHIAGATGTRYKPPACATMATYGNCPGEDDLCRRVRHPLSYYERRSRMLKPGPMAAREAGQR
ncbi:DNA primase regulatory subunit PriL [Methanothrix sp.]|uniref:DNA primase regulatory subunit PriL n=1 Tax=Methanothrix sp. TaxID=90426 RepID=UPI003C73B00D